MGVLLLWLSSIYPRLFDRIHHQALLLTLQQCGVGGTVLRWFSDNLSHRCQRVSSPAELSACPNQPIEQGVPQGSVLGPLLLNICLAHLPNLAMTEFGARLLLFADDKTLYADADSQLKACAVVSKALTFISEEVEQKGLQVNLDKTVSMIIRPQRSALDSCA